MIASNGRSRNASEVAVFWAFCRGGLARLVLASGLALVCQRRWPTLAGTLLLMGAGAGLMLGASAAAVGHARREE